MLEESVNFDIIGREVLVGGGVTWLDSQLTRSTERRTLGNVVSGQRKQEIELKAAEAGGSGLEGVPRVGIWG